MSEATNRHVVSFAQDTIYDVTHGKVVDSTSRRKPFVE
jgi:hypothetical protein